MKNKINAAELSNRSHWMALLKYAVPLMFTGVLQLLFNAADVVVVGRFAADGEQALGAVGSTSSLINLLVNVFMGLSVGASVCVSKHFGANNEKEVGRAVHTSVMLSIIAGVFVMIVGEIGSYTFLSWMKTPPQLIDKATLYMRIYFIGIPANMVYNFCAAIVRSVGNTKVPFVIISLAGIINILLNVIFVLVFGMDVDGVAWATTISQTLAAISMVIYLVRSNDVIKLRLSKLHINKKMLVEILTVGIPAGIQSAFFSISNVIIQSSINGFGDIAVSGNTAASNIEGFVYTMMNSFYHACLTFTGQVVGAGQKERTTSILLKCLIYVTVVGVFLGVFVGVFCGESLLKIYLPKAESAEARDYGAVRLSIVCLSYFLCGILDVLVGSMRGMGTSLTAMIGVLIGACGLRIVWVNTIFKLSPTLMTLYIAYPVSWLITDLVFAVLYIINKNRLVNGKRVMP